MLTLLFSVPLCLAACCGVERLFPGRALPEVPRWIQRIVGLLATRMILLVGIGFLWEEWLAKWSLFRLTEIMNPMAAAFVAYFASTFVYYWWHRARHESKILWRVFHQLHHSPSRIETLTAFYRHPLEIAADGLIGAFIVYTVFGLPLEAPIYYSVFGALGQFFIHMNLKTPRWFGFVVQRPEMHRLHHGRDRHTNNYSEIAWWDMLFGTYENPAEFRGECGFGQENEERLAEMLGFREIARPRPIFKPKPVRPPEPVPPPGSMGQVAGSLISVLLVVGVIVFMVAAVAIPCSFSARRSSNDVSARQTLRNIASAQDSFARGPGRGNYATRLEDLRDWLDDSVIHAQRTPKSGYLLGELKTTPKTALAPATFSIDTFPAQTRGISRSGNSSFFIDQTADLRSSGNSDERATVSSRKTGD